jgi:alpha-beta hydrolase superfamily lysophospholipase
MIRTLARRLKYAAASALFGLGLIAAVGYALFIRNAAPPERWHLEPLPDFTAAQAGRVTTLADYLALEQRLFAALDERVRLPPAPGDVFNRFRSGSLSDPRIWPTDWNRSFLLEPAGGAAPRGTVLLLHGLTDSPYSLRSIGEHLAARGYAVFGLRLPGHGTAPSGLLSVRVEDMRAAVQLAVHDLKRRAPPGRPLLLVGYSNGAALAVDYTLAAMADAGQPRPDGLVLVSPAIAITPFAAIAQLRTGLSSVPGFERAAWQLIQTEFDPYKYNSFSFNAAGQTHRLTQGLARELERRADGGVVSGFPPTLVFVSAVDSTVDAGAASAVLLDRLAPGGHELVVFDVNRLAAARSLLVEDPGALTDRLRARSRRPYGLTVIGNLSAQTQQVAERRAAAGSAQFAERPLDLAWPRGVFSLSHVALPFAPDDPLYGLDAAPAPHAQLGRLEVRGENGVLTVPAWALMRLRSNPFHAYLLERIDGFADALPAPR